MPTPDDVQWFGWELHYEGGNSDKFYRFMVTFAPTPRPSASTADAATRVPSV